MTLLDQRTDVSRAFLVKTASRLQDKDLASEILKIAEENSGDSASCFACEDGMLFPVDTKEQTMLSRVYFNGQRGMFAEKTAQEIDKALNVFEQLYGIEGDFSLAGLCKTASAAEYELMPGYKVRGSAGLKRAGADFMEKQAKMSIPDRVEFSVGFVKAAEEEGADIPESIRQYGGEYFCDAGLLKEALHLRKIAAKRINADGAPFDKLAEEFAKEDLKEAGMDKLAEMAGRLQWLDESFGFDHPRYDSRMPNAWQAVFNTKTAEDDESPKGEEQKKNPESMTKADVIARFGEDALDEIENENGDIDYDRLKNVIRLFGGKDADADRNSER